MPYILYKDIHACVYKKENAWGEGEGVESKVQD